MTCPLVVAHRGASGYAPENTFAAFDRALELRAAGIETDVRLSSDGVLVLMHDSHVDRTTDGKGRVAGMTWEQLSVLDAGSWHGGQWAGERVPRVEGLLERYAGRALLCLEIKAAKALQPLCRLLRGMDLAGRPDLAVTSFSWQVCEQARLLLPDLVVGHLTHGFDRRGIEWAAGLGLRQIWPRASALRADLVSLAHGSGFQVFGWDVSDRWLLGRALQAEPDGLALDFPDWVETGL